MRTDYVINMADGRQSDVDDLLCRIKRRIKKGGVSKLNPERLIRELQVITEQVINPSYPDIRLYNEFKITVPIRYDHDRQLGLLRMGGGRYQLSYLDARISDETFARTTHRLIPGRRYNVDLFHVTRIESPLACLEFLESQNALFVSAQGLALVFQLKTSTLPKGSTIVSYDLESALPRDEDANSFLPRLTHHFSVTMDSRQKGRWEFDLINFKRYMGICDRPTYLMCFREEPLVS